MVAAHLISLCRISIPEGNHAVIQSSVFIETWLCIISLIPLIFLRDIYQNYIYSETCFEKMAIYLYKTYFEFWKIFNIWTKYVTEEKCKSECYINLLTIFVVNLTFLHFSVQIIKESCSNGSWEAGIGKFVNRYTATV